MNLQIRTFNFGVMLHVFKTTGPLCWCEFIAYFTPTQAAEQAACLSFAEEKHIYVFM